jgi:hypothetical protein
MIGLIRYDMENKIFTKLEDVFEDGYFRNQLLIEIENIQFKRKHRSLLKPGYRYRRDEIDRMIESDHMNFWYFIENLQDLYNKTSKIGSNERQIMMFVSGICIKRTILAYQSPVTP